MFETADQIFVLLKHWLVGLLPMALQPVAGVVVSVAAIVCFFPLSDWSTGCCASIQKVSSAGSPSSAPRWP